MGDTLKSQFGAEIVHRLAAGIVVVHPRFDAPSFTRDALQAFESRELLDRGRHIAAMLQRHLPSDFGSAVDILLATLDGDPAHRGGMASFYYLPHTEFIKTFGVAHFEHSMRALHALTQRFTGEFAIRPFLERSPDATLARLREWSEDPSEHVRRLVSEGTRPRLPWAPRLRAFQRDPTPVLALLELLRDDPALYVRRSVANNLNDIGKDNPAVLVHTAGRWMDGASAERRWIVQHALRSAIKRGDAAALRVLGYAHRAQLDVSHATITPRQPELGSRVVIACTVSNPSRRTQHVIVDLIVHFVKANGSASPKVFKLRTVEVPPGASVDLRKTVSLADLTTRAHYVGLHRVELQMNGARTPLGSFTLRAAR